MLFIWIIWAFALLLTTHLMRNKFKHGLSDIPGPTIASYTKLWRLYDVWYGRAHWTATELHRKYGRLVRIAPNVISVADPRMVPIIYNTKGDFIKSAFYPIQCITWQKRPQMNLFSTRDEAEHREQKKKIANAYNLESLLKMEAAIDSCGELFMARMRDYASRGDPVDLGEWLQYYAFDVVGELTFDRKLGFLEKGGDVDGMMKAIEGLLLYASQCGQVPELHPFLLGNPLIPMLIPQMEQWNQILTFTLKAINKRTNINRDGELELEESHVRNDMLSKWAAVKSVDPLKMSTRDVIVHLSTNVFAGSDTTAIALRAILYFLIKNPLKMRALHKEIDDAYGAGKLSEPVKDKEARTELPYLNAVIKEAMRLHPSAGLLMERHVPPQGAMICGKFIPGHTIVGVSAWPLHYDAEVFEEPHSFKPERWLESESSKEKLAIMEKSILSFGAGSRVCIGKNISLIEMRKIIPRLLHEFDVDIVGNKEWTVRNSWFVQQRMPECILTQRRRV